ncbi:MAG: bacterio-opsin activator domain-containing protein [Euryarchaeota archaeon]|nr:bacterio-opsin activator domain-containing protein [Euryarchaeota archaeon]
MREHGEHNQQSSRGGGSPSVASGSGVLAELVDEAVVTVDTGGVISAANSRFEILTGTAAAELIGRPLSAFVVENDAEKLGAVLRALQSREHGEQTTIGVSLRTGDEAVVACQLSLAVDRSTNGSKTATGIVGTVRPVDIADAELKRRASQQAAVATLGQLAIESDDIDDLMAEATRLVSETLDCDYAKVLDFDADRDRLLVRQGVGWQAGTVGTATVAADTNSQAGYTLLNEGPVIVDDLEAEPRFSGAELLTTHDVTSGISVVIGNRETPWGILGVHDTRHRQFTDDDANFVQSMANVLVSAIDRHERTRELQRYERIIETVNDGVYTVGPEGRFTMVNRAYCELTGYDREELLGADTSLLIEESVAQAVSEIEAEILAETVDTPTMEAEIQTADDDSVTVEATLALLPSDDEWERVGVVRDISERKAYERQLETERTKLAALNEVNAVVREITNAILDQSTRSEIEQLVCESLAAFDSYRFAWIGEVNAHTQEIDPLAEAGVDGYLDDTEISTDPADPMSRGPAGRAVETQQLQVSQDVFADPRFEPWRTSAEQWGYQSVAAIPITHDGTLYGVLGLYADEPDAFSPEKQAIITQLGEIVGHAIAAVERKQALMSDVVTEVKFEVRGVFSPADATFNNKIVLDHVVPVGDDTYLQYGRTTPEMASTLEEFEAQHPSCESVTILSEIESEIRFELRVTEPPVTSLVAAAGGSVKEARIENNDLRMTVHLPQSADVRRLLDRLQQQYSAVRPIARRQVNRSETSPERIINTWTDELTDRQRASLEAAYFAGFFEWPRDSSGKDLAATMDVSSATFHQHLRAAERKLFEILLDDPEVKPSIPQ